MIGAMPHVDIQQSMIALQGGLDLVTPALSVPPGVLIDACNFVPEISGGYKRVGGYERYSGLPKPSEQTYWMAQVADSSSLSVGLTITGMASGATAKIVAIESRAAIVLTRRSAAFTPNEQLLAGGLPSTTLLSTTSRGASTPTLDANYLALAADDYRADIQPVPGSGPVRGVWVYKGVVYAFRNTVDGSACAMYKATGAGWTLVTTPALLPGGVYEFANYNFSGAAAGQKMYGCDGVNKAFEFDGTTFTQITTTASPDTPAHVATHRNRLFLAIAGSLFVSGPGAPLTGWAGVGTTPAEIGIGDVITNLLSIQGDGVTGALAVYARNKTSILYGSSTATWNLSPIAPDAGGVSGTAQFVSAALTLDDRGVTQLTATQNFGNFAAASISAKVQPFVDARRGMVTTSSVLRSQNQYRLYFSDGYGLVFRIENGQSYGALPIRYPNPVACMVSGENISGQEVVFFGSTTGYVYQAEVGTSFDGVAIESWARLAFNSEKSPNVRKQWRRARLELRVPKYAQVYLTHEQDYGDYSIPIAATSLGDFAQTVVTPGGGGFWDQFTWDQFTWDSPLVNPPSYRLSGTSQNISLLFFSNDRLSEPFTLQSVTLSYTPRRLKRG